MGKKDVVTKEYMKDPVRFADAFNKYLYGGEQVIRSEQLRELDAEEIVLPYGSDNADAVVQRYRDALMLVMTDGDMAYCILGIENQGDIHYAMPVKNGLYDFIRLAGQVTETARMHRASRKTEENSAEETAIKETATESAEMYVAGHKAAGTADQTQNLDAQKRYKPTSGEFLSGFYKTDKLLPVVTLVIYFGTDEWDGPLSLKEMYTKTDEKVIQYAPDYKVNLIAPYHMTDEEIGEFKTDLREVMTFLKYAKDKRKLGEAVQKDENFRHMDRQTVNVINVTANANLKYSEEKEDVDMCLAIQQMMEESERKGENNLFEATQKLRNNEDISVLKKEYGEETVKKALLLK